MRLGADVVGDRGEDRRVLGEVERAARGQPRRGGLRRSATTSIASVAEPPLPSASSVPPASKRARSARRGGEQRVRALVERLLAQRADLLGLGQRPRPRTSSSTASRSCSSRRGRGRGSSTRRCRGPAPRRGPRAARGARRRRARAPRARGRRSRPAPGATNGSSARRHELPLGADGAKAIVRQPRAPRRAPRRRRRRRRRRRSRCRRARRAARPGRAAPRGSASAGSARLPTITGCTNSTATWRASERVGRRRAEREQPPAAREALRHRGGRAARARSASAAKKRSFASRARASSARCGRRAVAAVRSRRGAAAAAGSPASQSRSSSTPSPVRALTSRCGDARVHRVEVVQEAVEVEVEVREQVDLVDHARARRRGTSAGT